MNGFIVNAASTREATLHDREPAYQPANGGLTAQIASNAGQIRILPKNPHEIASSL
ncbi:MAG: hypothetical protein J0H17_04725 [Rhizobiales bacterium]|nr:hypothetical protein [Hyphomicrobiales bacterium]